MVPEDDAPDWVRQADYSPFMLFVPDVLPEKQEFIPAVVTKIAQVRKMIEDRKLETLIQVDGGISHETLQLTYQAGARVFVAATAIFKNPGGIAAGIQTLRNAVPGNH